MGDEHSKGSSDEKGGSWKDHMTAAMAYDIGRYQCSNTGNKIIDAIGGYLYKKSNNESEKNWEKARQSAEKEGASKEFESKKKDFDDYMFDKMFSLDDLYD